MTKPAPLLIIHEWQVIKLRHEAEMAGDDDMCNLCDGALEGDDACWNQCAEIITNNAREFANDQS